MPSAFRVVAALGCSRQLYARCYRVSEPDPSLLLQHQHVAKGQAGTALEGGAGAGAEGGSAAVAGSVSGPACEDPDLATPCLNLAVLQPWAPWKVSVASSHCARVHACLCVCVCMSVHVSVHVCLRACMSACVHACVHAQLCLHVCVSVCVHTCVHACLRDCCPSKCCPGTIAPLLRLPPCPGGSQHPEYPRPRAALPSHPRPAL